MAERPPVSGSMAGHCRLDIWFASKQYPIEGPLPHVQRTFDLGHVIEQIMIDGIGTMANERHGPWWPQIGEIVDHSTGEIITTSEWEIACRQEEVEVDGFVGHIDGVAGRPKTGDFFIPDVKTMPSLTWDRNLTGDLMANPFSREYVLQLQFYIEGWNKLHPSLQVTRGCLINFNKENSKVAARFVGYDPGLVAELKERLSWARKDSAPPPDWAWEKGKPIPLRCGYCGYREHCAALRGQAITLKAERGTPKWIVS